MAGANLPAQSRPTDSHSLKAQLKPFSRESVSTERSLAVIHNKHNFCSRKREPQSLRLASERGDAPFQLLRNLRCVCIGGKMKRCAYRHRDFAAPRHVPPTRFEFKQSVEANGHDGCAQTCCEQARAGHERIQAPVLRALPLWKDEHTVAAIHRLAREGEAAPKAAVLRQREDVEECNHERITHAQ